MCKLFILSLIFVLAACQEQGTETHSNTGSIAPSIVWASSDQQPILATNVPSALTIGAGTTLPIGTGNTLPADLATVRLVVTGDGLTSPISSVFDASLRSGTISGIPAGDNRTVTVEGLNNSNAVIYKGIKEDISVMFGTATSVAITAIEIVNQLPVNPVTPLTSLETLTNQDSIISREQGFEGEIEFDGLSIFEALSGTFNFQLSSGTPSINVVDVQRVQSAIVSCSDGTNINHTISSDYSSGGVTVTRVIDGLDTTCFSNFPIIVPVTISDGSSISSLFGSGDFDPANSATCPEFDTDFDPNRATCDGSSLTNYTVTDDGGGIHKISTRFSLTPI